MTWRALVPRAERGLRFVAGAAVPLYIALNHDIMHDWFRVDVGGCWVGVLYVILAGVTAPNLAGVAEAAGHGLVGMAWGGALATISYYAACAEGGATAWGLVAFAGLCIPLSGMHLNAASQTHAVPRIAPLVAAYTGALLFTTAVGFHDGQKECWVARALWKDRSVPGVLPFSKSPIQSMLLCFAVSVAFLGVRATLPLPHFAGKLYLTTLFKLFPGDQHDHADDAALDGDVTASDATVSLCAIVDITHWSARGYNPASRAAAGIPMQSRRLLEAGGYAATARYDPAVAPACVEIVRLHEGAVRSGLLEHYLLPVLTQEQRHEAVCAAHGVAASRPPRRTGVGGGEALDLQKAAHAALRDVRRVEHGCCGAFPMDDSDGTCDSPTVRRDGDGRAACTPVTVALQSSTLATPGGRRGASTVARPGQRAQTADEMTPASKKLSELLPGAPAAAAVRQAFRQWTSAATAYAETKSAVSMRSMCLGVAALLLPFTVALWETVKCLIEPFLVWRWASVMALSSPMAKYRAQFVFAVAWALAMPVLSQTYRNYGTAADAHLDRTLSVAGQFGGYTALGFLICHRPTMEQTRHHVGYRVFGTLLGGLFGYAAVKACGVGSSAWLVSWLCVTFFLSAAAAAHPTDPLLRPHAAIGAGVRMFTITEAVVVIESYHRVGNVDEVAVSRVMGLLAGLFIAVFVSHVLWPVSLELQARRQLADVLEVFAGLSLEGAADPTQMRELEGICERIRMDVCETDGQFPTARVFHIASTVQVLLMTAQACSTAVVQNHTGMAHVNLCQRTVRAQCAALAALLLRAPSAPPRPASDGACQQLLREAVEAEITSQSDPGFDELSVRLLGEIEAAVVSSEAELRLS